MLANGREQVRAVLDLVDFVGIEAAHLLFDLLQGCPEALLVLASHLENGAVVGNDQLFIIRMGRRPLIIIKVEVEHITIQQFSDFNPLFHDNREVSLKQERGDEVILIVNNVPNDLLDCTGLIILETDIHGVSVVHFACFWTLQLVREENREVFVVEVSKIFVQKTLDRFGIIRQNVQHVGLIELEICLIEDLGIRLFLDQSNDI